MTYPAPASLRELSLVQEAARTLFGPAEPACRRFWAHLTLIRVKKAFREQVKRCHPDAQAQASPKDQQLTRDRFVAVKHSYDLLRDFLARRAAPAAPPRPLIIAVAGPTGGAGKSMVAANLGVWLARQGRRSVLADLDPSDPTLPFYLGESHPAWTTGDAFREEIALGALARPNRYGPALLPRLELCLYDAPADRRQRRHFYRALKRLPAEVVMLDLGSGAAPGTLDFFTWADRPLVVTTCDPVAMVRTYAFLKAACGRRDEHRRPRLSEAGPHPEDLMPGGWLPSGLEDFAPLLLLNQVKPGDQVQEVARRLQEMAAGSLGLHLQSVILPYREEIAQNARDLVPAVARHPGGFLARHLACLGRLLGA